MARYPIPAATVQVEQEVARSRFIATLAYADSTAAARAEIARVRAAMPDASHHVYAFRVGYGSTITEGVSDDGEPAGTSGPPILAVLRGAPVGDVVIVVTRYFGGTKLGTGGLVRAYGDAARLALATMTTRQKILQTDIRVTLPYSLYTLIERTLATYEAAISHKEFAADITLTLTLPTEYLEMLTAELRTLSAGKVVPLRL